MLSRLYGQWTNKSHRSFSSEFQLVETARKGQVPVSALVRKMIELIWIHALASCTGNILEFAQNSEIKFV